MDEFEGVYEEPESLHKYVFAGNDGVNRVDYSGMMYDVVSFATTYEVMGVLSLPQSKNTYPLNYYKEGIRYIKYFKLAYLPIEGIGINASYTIEGYYNIQKYKSLEYKIKISLSGYTSAVKYGIINWSGSVCLKNNNEKIYEKKNLKRKNQPILIEKGYQYIGDAEINLPIRGKVKLLIFTIYTLTTEYGIGVINEGKKVIEIN